VKRGSQRPKGEGGLHTRAQMVCGMKQRHVSERIAQERASERAQVEGFRIYTYRCKNCKGWHLTKRRQR
jgi:hypothetical protein